VSGPEIGEARSDPASFGNAAWYDAQGAENGDKCNWTFLAPYVTFPDGSIWKMQSMWSNKQYSQTGSSGCINGA
jgi:hypothetical protein